MFSDLPLLNKLYDRFNARDIDAALALMHPDVEWANGMEGGHVSGHHGVRAYWTRQWAAIDPHVDPTTFNRGPDKKTVVEVHQTVRDLWDTCQHAIDLGAPDPHTKAIER